MGPDGALWFAESGCSTCSVVVPGKIGRITTGGAITEYPLPTGSTGPYSITTGADGALWFTELTSSKIARINTVGAITEYLLPASGSGPNGITGGPDGALWFTEAYSSKIGRITVTGVIAEYPIPTSNCQPYGITTGPDGALWFVETNGNNVGRITTAGAITEYPIPTMGSGPIGIATGPDGSLWFTEENGNNIGRATVAGVITEYPSPTSGAQPYGIAAAPDGALWFTEFGAGQIGRITTAGVLTEYPIPSSPNDPFQIATGPDGALWFTEYNGAKIERAILSSFPPPASCTFVLSASSVTVGASTTTGTVGVTGPAGCAYTAVAPSGSFASITNGASGSGSGSIGYSVQANSGGPRSATLTIAGLSFTINQFNGCVFGLTPSNATAPASGGTGSFSLGASGSNCSFTAVSNNPSFLSINGSAAGSGTASISYMFATNSSSTGRTGTITVAGQTFTLVQAGTACGYSLAQAAQAFTSAGGTGTVILQAPAGCPWTAQSNSPFLTIQSGTGGSGSGTVSFSALANPAGSQRTGSLTIAGQTFAVTESGASPLNCTANVPAAAQVAIEGRTEVLGDLILICTGLTGPLSADISLTLNTDVTNSSVGGVTDAGLLVNGSNSMGGVAIGNSTIDWSSVSLVPAGGGTATVRITNVRADASLLGASANLQSVPLTAVVSVNAPAPLPVTNPTQTLAFAAPSFLFQELTASTQGTQTTLPVQFQEAGTTAFHAGTSPTRLRVVVTGIPSGVQVFAPVFPNEGVTRAQLYSAQPDGSGGAPVAGVAGSFTQLSVTGGGTSGGVATATWVLLSSDPTQFETETFPLMLQNATPQILSQIQASASLGPVSAISFPNATATPPVPRYRDFSTAQSVVNLRATITAAASSSAAFSGQSRSAPRLSSAAGGTSLVFTTQLINDNQNTSSTDTTATSVIAVSKITGGTITSCTTTAGNCAISASGISAMVNVGAMSPMQVATVAVTVTATACTFNLCEVQDSASFSSDQPNASASSASSVYLFGGATLTTGISHVGNFTQGQSGAPYTITVQDIGAGAWSGMSTVTATLPQGFTTASMAGTGWTCAVVSVSCTRSDPLAAGAAYPPITLMVNVPAGAASPAATQVNLSAGGSLVASATDSATILTPFVDVSSGDVFLSAIDLLREYAITTGCGPSMFCPAANIIRSDMAVFVVRSIIGGDNFTYTQVPYFTDVPATHPEFPWVQKMRDLGITTGCGATTYCPNDQVTRGQMAVFIIRARFGATATFNYPTAPSFTDVGTDNSFFAWIQKMQQLGITTGCGPTTYCPNDAVTREQMATFIMRGAFNQLLPAGTPVVTSVSPASGPAGSAITVTLTGQNTNWVNGLTQVGTAPAITVVSLLVTSSTTLTVQLGVSASAAPGPYSLTTITGSEEATLPNGFTVTAAGQ